MMLQQQEQITGGATNVCSLDRLYDLSINRDPDFTEGVLDLLEKLSVNVSAYISWWNSVQMSSEGQRAEYQQLDNMIRDPRRKRIVNDKWLEFKKRYKSYNDKVFLVLQCV